MTSIDSLRGLVMVLMALDHVRDFFHAGAMSFSPTDLTKTTAILFLTRWITHFCLPVFMFTAGAGAFLWQRMRGHTNRELSKLLWTRGLWFIILELTLMQFAYDFNISSRFPIFLLILWIFGLCMIVMSTLIYLRPAWLLALSAAVIAGHNLLDRVDAAQFGSAGWLWRLIHQPGVFPLAGRQILITYTLLPWIGVISAGFCFGYVLEWVPAKRRAFMLRAGLAAVAAFFVLRAINRYGDPAPWSVQKSVVFTALSFLNCTKYPASLDFLLMTLGPALLLLAFLDMHPPASRNPLVIFGRVPMFYFVLHFYLIHLLMVAMAFLRYGASAVSFMSLPPPSMGTPPQFFPPHFGYSLAFAYAMWILVVVTLYPICKWYGKIKASHRSPWLTYL